DGDGGAGAGGTAGGARAASTARAAPRGRDDRRRGGAADAPAHALPRQWPGAVGAAAGTDAAAAAERRADRGGDARAPTAGHTDRAGVASGLPDPRRSGLVFAISRTAGRGCDCERQDRKSTRRPQGPAGPGHHGGGGAAADRSALTRCRLVAGVEPGPVADAQRGFTDPPSGGRQRRDRTGGGGG